MDIDDKKLELKHLGFVRMAAINALVCVSNLYEYAKQNSGPWRSTVGTVEGAVTTVVRPVYEKFKGLPDDILVFADKKVDEATEKFDKLAPPVAKRVVGKAHSFIQKASQKAQKLVDEALTGGPRAAAHYAATEYKQFVVTQSVKMWVKLNQFSTVHSVANMVVPTAALWSDKYNQTVKDMTEKGYTLFGYFPLVPVDEIAKTFKQYEETKTGDAPAHKSDNDSSDSD